MPTNKEITENLPYTRKGICAECGKSIPLDSEGNSEYDFFQHRRYSTMNYKIDYHFCSQSCMQKKIGKQPLSNIQVRADTAKQIFSEIDKIINMPQSEITANHNMGTEYLSLKKEFNIEA